MIQQAFQTILNTLHKQLITLLPNIYHKEIHEFHTLNKGLEIHLPQIVQQSLRDLSLPFRWISNSKQSIQIYNHNKISKLINTHITIGLA